MKEWTFHNKKPSPSRCYNHISIHDIGTAHTHSHTHMHIVTYNMFTDPHECFKPDFTQHHPESYVIYPRSFIRTYDTALGGGVHQSLR